MPYTLECRENGTYIQLTHKDKVTLSELECGRAEAIRMMLAFGLKRLLVDVCQVTTDLSLHQHFLFTSSHVNILPQDLKVAVLIRPNIVAIGNFIEDVAVNRGFNLYVFTDNATAVTWLCSD